MIHARVPFGWYCSAPLHHGGPCPLWARWWNVRHWRQMRWWLP